MDEDGSTVHVWHVSLSASVASALLSDDERERAERFRIDRDRRRFIACRSALRQILAERLGQPAGQIMFAYGSRGKPYVAGSKIRFNLSHSGDDALIAIATGREVGIDVERPDGRLSPDELAIQFLTAGERAFVDDAPRDRQLIAFLACWTRKEAWAKAVGTGLSEDLARFDVSDSLNVPSCVLRDATIGAKWTVSELALADNLIGAIVVEGTDVTASLHHFDQTGR
jgi:4'-phosphopantetheinyl transferase